MAFLNQVCNALQHTGVRYAVVGGYAVALHGAVRGTVDVDIIVDWKKANLVRLQHTLEELGLRSRLPITAEDVFNFREEYIANRNLIAWNFYHPDDPTRCVDVIITFDLRGQKRRKRVTTGGTVHILDRDALIRMKMESARPQDLADIEALRKLE